MITVLNRHVRRQAERCGRAERPRVPARLRPDATARLVVRPGAIAATLENVLGRTTTQSRNLRSIVDRVRRSVEMIARRARSMRCDAEDLMRDAVWANVRASANHLPHGSDLLEQRIRTDALLVVGAEYSLESGVVTFVDGVPEEA